MIARFAALYRLLEETTRTGEKVEALVDYFRQVDAADGAWAVHLLSGEKLKRLVPYSRLRQWGQAGSGLPAWLFEESYQAVGDLAETLSLIVPSRAVHTEGTLAQWAERELPALVRPTPEESIAAIADCWQRVGPDERLVVLKMLTGAMRVGVSQKLVARAIAEAFEIPVEQVQHRMMGRPSPTANFFRELTASTSTTHEPFRPYPFCLAHPLENQSAEGTPPQQPSSEGRPAEANSAGAGAAVVIEPSEHLVEWKWDGIRCQLIARGGELFLWSRGEERLEERFPEVATSAQTLPAGTVLDGELLAWRDGRPLAFQQLQRRIQRKQVGKKLLAEVPVSFLAFDILEADGIDLRQSPLRHRREKLETLMQGLAPPTSDHLRLSPRVDCADRRALEEARTKARREGAEGLMIKPLDSPYAVGRVRGIWWKWKVNPFTVDAVMIYAQRGHGRRASLYTDYTFALWDGGELVPVAKAYSGLTDEEIRRVDRFVRENTREQFGPVRSVTPQLVMEIAFENVQPSPRHKSGIAVRFPRIVRIRDDKRIEGADSLQTLREMATRMIEPQLDAIETSAIDHDEIERAK
jgi:DNA ligase-1